MCKERMYTIWAQSSNRMPIRKDGPLLMDQAATTDKHPNPLETGSKGKFVI